MSDLTTLFRPRSVALIGASSDPKKYGYWTAKSLIDNKFTGKIYFVSRTSAGDIMGIKPHASILDIKDDVDLAIVGIAPQHIIPVIEDCGKKGVKSIIVVATGFGETGEEGKEIERKMRELTKQYDMNLMGPNCMGMFSSSVSLNASIIDLAKGSLSLALQSGNFGIDINVNAKKRGLGYSCWATIGNQIDIRFHDFVKYMGMDTDTKAILLYMEGLRVESEEDGRNFFDIAKQVSLKKPIAAIKIGRSEAGARAAASHTGSLAGSEKVFDAALRQCGVIRVDSPTELLDVAEAFSVCKPAHGKRIAILTDGGGHGVMATDMAERFGLEAPVLSEKTQEALRAVLKPHCPIKNPVDLAGTPEGDMWVFDRCLEILLQDTDVDGIIIVGLYGGYADLSQEFAVMEMDVAKSMSKRINASNKAVVMHSIYQPIQPECLQFLTKNGLPVFGGVEAAMRAMGALVSYTESKKDLEEEGRATALALPQNRKAMVKTIFDKVRSEKRVNLMESEARDVLSAYGFDMPKHYIATSADEAGNLYTKLGGKVVMKIVSPEILHKTDAKGVMLNIDSAEAAKTAYGTLLMNGKLYNPKAHIHGVLITTMLPMGVECIIGSSYDTTFGATVMFGLGGIFVEVLKDVAFRVAPVNMPQSRKMLTEIKGLPLLQGARGMDPVNMEILAETISKLSYMVNELSNDVAEVDLNPVFATKDGIALVDARIVLHEK